MTAQWPDYDKYQAGTKRDIPVVLLSPAERMGSIGAGYSLIALGDPRVHLH
jgi:hypothetical protein